MSHVLDIIITASLGDEDKGDALTSELAKVYYSAQIRPFVDCTTLAAGNKALQAVVFLGAFNYLRIEDLRLAINRVPWESPEEVQAFVKDEHDEVFTELPWQEQECPHGQPPEN